MTYKDEYIASTQHPDEFWLEQAKKLAWFQLLKKDVNLQIMVTSTGLGEGSLTPAI
jgi:hypothetical protein